MIDALNLPHTKFIVNELNFTLQRKQYTYLTLFVFT